MADSRVEEKRTILIVYNQKTGEFFLRNFEPRRKVVIHKIGREVTNAMRLLGDPTELTFVGDDRVINDMHRTYYLITVEAPSHAFYEGAPFTCIGSAQKGFFLPERDRKF